jgi:hypothetical protein
LILFYDAVFEKPLPPVDFQDLVRSIFLREMGRWDAKDIGRFAHSILPRFLFDLGLRVKGRTGNLYTLSRIMSGHYTA